MSFEEKMRAENIWLKIWTFVIKKENIDVRPEISLKIYIIWWGANEGSFFFIENL